MHTNFSFRLLVLVEQSKSYNSVDAYARGDRSLYLFSFSCFCFSFPFYLSFAFFSLSIIYFLVNVKSQQFLAIIYNFKFFFMSEKKTQKYWADSRESQTQWKCTFLLLSKQQHRQTNKQTNKHQVNQVKYRNKSEYQNRFAVALEVEKVNGFLSSQDPFIPLIHFSSVRFWLVFW